MSTSLVTALGQFNHAPTASPQSLFSSTPLFDSPSLTPMSLFLSVALLSTLYLFLRSDYLFFLSLGPGGVPSTFRGYTKTLLLRLISHSKSSVLSPPKLSSYSGQLLPPYFETGRDDGGARIEKGSRWGSSEENSSKSLPYRQGPRPYTAGLAPHRQITQRAPAEWVLRLEGALRRLAAENSSKLCTGKSCFEKHSLGVFLAYALCSRIADAPPSPAKGSVNFATSQTEIQSGIGEVGSTTALCGDESLHIRGKSKTCPASPPPRPIQTTCGYPPEIAHMHGTDGSLHVTLHPLDVAYILKKGWGERHPLAGRWLGSGFMMIYAPRDENELRVVLEIVQAGARWVGGVEWAT